MLGPTVSFLGADSWAPDKDQLSGARLSRVQFSYNLLGCALNAGNGRRLKTHTLCYRPWAIVGGLAHVRLSSPIVSRHALRPRASHISLLVHTHYTGIRSKYLHTDYFLLTQMDSILSRRLQIVAQFTTTPPVCLAPVNVFLLQPAEVGV